MHTIFSKRYRLPIKSEWWGVGYLNNTLLAESSVPSNMAEGICHNKTFGVGQLKSLHEVLQEAFDKIPKGKFALIILDDRETTSYEVVNRQIRCQCRKVIHALKMDVAMQANDRPPPIYHCTHYTHGEDEVKAWISGQRNQDLVVSYELIRGFENDIILDTTATFEVMSRCSAQLISLHTNSFLDLMCVNEGILKGTHECQDIMKRELRSSLVPLSVETLIGKTCYCNKYYVLRKQKHFSLF